MLPNTYSASFDALPGPIYISDMETGALRFANRAFLALLGYPRESLPSLNLLDLVHPDDRTALVEYMQELQLDSKVRQQLLVRFKNQGGGWPRFRASHSSLPPAAGESRSAMIGMAVAMPASVPELAGMLTRREMEVARLLSEGLSSKEIARRLGISQNTVETHKYNSMRKINVRNSAGLVRYALLN